MTAENTGVDDVDVRGDWWHLVAFTPVAFVVAGVVGGWIAALLLLPTLVLYPVALYRDVTYLRSVDGADEIRRDLWTAAGVVASLTLGIGSFVVTPVYLWNRWEVG